MSCPTCKQRHYELHASISNVSSTSTKQILSRPFFPSALENHSTIQCRIAIRPLNSHIPNNGKQILLGLITKSSEVSPHICLHVPPKFFLLIKSVYRYTIACSIFCGRYFDVRFENEGRSNNTRIIASSQHYKILTSW